MAEASGSDGAGASATPIHSADGSRGCLDGGGLIRSSARRITERCGDSHTMLDIGLDFTRRLSSIESDL